MFLWSQQESNLHLKFRKLLFYPLNYGTNISKKKELIAEFLYFVAGTRLERATFGLWARRATNCSTPHSIH